MPRRSFSLRRVQGNTTNIMKQKLKNLLCSAALLLGATAATAQGLQNIIVEEFHTVTQADADAYNNDHGGGSFPLVAGMKTYRVYVDMAPNYRLTSVFATPNSPLSVNSTTTFWNDDNWGSEGPGQTRRLDEGNLFDSFITINTASTSSTGTTPCGATAHTSQFGVQRTADTNGDLFTCGVYPGFTGADGHIPVPFAMDPLVFLGSINYQALTSDPAPAGSFGYSNALYGYTGGITGVDPSGSNIAFIGQFTTDGTFTFNLNVALILPSPSTATEEYVHTSPNVGQIQSSLLIFPQPNLDCEGTPGGTALPGTACNDNDPLTGNDTWDANCVCAGLLIDCEGTPGGTALPGTACNDNDPLTGNDTWGANCVCAGLVIDCEGTPGGTALPGTACNDLNPNTSNDVWSANCVCAGILANDCEGTPGGPAQPGTACNDNNPLTGNDTWDANCVCAGLLIDCEGTPGGTALPGTSCNDNNPLTGNDTWDANCVCAGLLIDCEGTPGGAALPGTACNDNNACTINDVYDANCNCSGTFEDTDSDGVCDANDNCPTVTGQIGSACDDSNANTINDQLNAACQCVGTPVGPGCDFNEVELVVENDAVSIVSYEVRAQGTNILAANGSVNPGTGTTVQDICLPDGCYYLVVSDNGGDGIVGGGYVLRLAAGGRLIDNAGNMTVSPSQIAANEGFCLPLGSDRLIATSCDKLDWRTAPCVPEYVVANANALVSAQYGVTNTTSGYQMWWYDPNGGYSFKRFQSHSTANGLVASATRACHFKINAWTGNQLQEGVLYNVKVRGRVAGTYNAWGPACRFSVDNAAAQCPQARLNNIAGNQFFSCGVTRPVAANAYVYSTVVRRMQANCNWLNANRYQFRFRIASEGFELVKTSSTWSVNTLGLACGKTYEVDVRASFDGGASWCATGDPYGTVCSLTTTACSFAMAQEATSGTAVEARLSMYPNPNRGDQLFLSIGSIEEGVETVSVDIYDAFGKRVSARTIAAQDGFVNSMVELNGELSAGFYLVSVTAGGASWSERLVIQR